jgi:hypothetical protein
MPDKVACSAKHYRAAVLPNNGVCSARHCEWTVGSMVSIVVICVFTGEVTLLTFSPPFNHECLAFVCLNLHFLTSFTSIYKYVALVV